MYVKFYVPDDVKEVDVADLGLSVRATNALYRNGIRTVGEMFDFDGKPKDFSKLRNMGKKTVAEIGTGVFKYVFENLTDDTAQVKYLRQMYALNCSDNEHLRSCLTLLQRFIPDDESIKLHLERLERMYA